MSIKEPLVLFVDTETSGVTNKDWVVQLGWILAQENNILCEGNFVCKSDLRPIHPEAQKIHGISTEMADLGIPTEDIFRFFLESVWKADLVVCHNYAFDSRFIYNTLCEVESEWEADRFKAIPYVCTMRSTTDLCGLKNIKGNKKPPKLIELYEELFTVPFDQSHGALSDALATMYCYYELKSRGHYES